MCIIPGKISKDPKTYIADNIDVESRYKRWKRSHNGSSPFQSGAGASIAREHTVVFLDDLEKKKRKERQKERKGGKKKRKKRSRIRYTHVPHNWTHVSVPYPPLYTAQQWRCRSSRRVSRALAAHPVAPCATAISAGTTTVAGTRAFATGVAPSVRHPSTSPTRPYATRNTSATWGWVVHASSTVPLLHVIPFPSAWIRDTFATTTTTSVGGWCTKQSSRSIHPFSPSNYPCDLGFSDKLKNNLLISICLQVGRCRKWCINNFVIIITFVSSNRLDF